MNRSTALNVLALSVALSLFVGPLFVFPAEADPDRIEYYVEANAYETDAWDDLAYDNFSSAERDVFDAARTDPAGTYNATLEESPARLTPPPDGISTFDVEYDGEYYLLQVKRFTDDVDFVSQLLPRLAAVAAGIAVGVGAAYRQFLS